jgi:hypothetical protein
MLSGAGDRVTYCMAYVPGDEEFRWRELLASSAVDFLGVVPAGNEIFMAAAGGGLYVLGRDASTAAAPTHAAITDASPIPNGWYWRAPAPIINYPALLSDGLLPLLLEGGRVFFLAPDGALAGEMQLPEYRGPNEFFDLPVYFHENRTVVVLLPDRIYAMQPEAGQLWEFPIVIADPSGDQFDGIGLHTYSSGDLEFLWDSSLTLSAYTPEEGLLWQQTLEAGLRDDFSGPAVTDTGRLYIADSAGALYAFDASGIAWTYHPEGNLRGASDPRIGPDGNLYYVLTNGTAGFLEAVSPDGQPIFRVQLTTFQFYTSPQFVAGGQFIRVDDDFVDAAAGALRPLEFPFEVAQFIEGEDGASYVHTGSHIIRWQIGPDGYEELRSYPVNMEGTNQFIQPFIRVYPDGFIEVQIFDQNAPRYLWVDPETGEIRSFERLWASIGFGTGEIGPEYVHCDQDLEALELTCVKEVPGSAGPVWSLTIQGIDGTVSGFPPPIVYRDGRMYILAGGENLYMIEVEIP